MIKIEEKYKCSGCHACYNICPKNAIKMKEDKYGFKYPEVDNSKCINCNLCKKVCPIINSKTKKEEVRTAYACYNKNEAVRKSSSSGGIFTLIATEIIKKQGVVFGAKFNKEFNVEHDYVEKVEDLYKFRGSKYVQSEIKDTYKKAKEFLERNRYVLFTGTPCQIEGIYSFLGKNYEKLYTQDIVCHGVPSKLVWEKYKKYLEGKFESKIINVDFRNKETGWDSYSVKITFDNKKEYIMKNSDDKYMRSFLRNTCLRDSCYNCNFKKIKRISDITLADFWGIQNICPELDDNKGTSLVSINSKKGKDLFDTIKDEIVFKEVEIQEAIKYNPSMVSSSKEDKNRQKFFKNLERFDFNKLVDKYTYKPNLLKRIYRRLQNNMKKIIKRNK